MSYQVTPRDNVPMCLMLLSLLYKHHESHPMQIYSLSKTTIISDISQTRKVPIVAIFCQGNQIRSIVEIEKSPLHVSFFNN